MNSFDKSILDAMVRSSLHSANFDRIISAVQGNLLIKGGMIMMIIWWLWFRKEKDESATLRTRRIIIAGFFAMTLATGLARIAHAELPFRARPLTYRELFAPPVGMSSSDAAYFHRDSSFPSDHATLFYALATMIFFVSPSVGVFTFIYVSVFIALPRVYLLLHFPTDILAGVVLGVGVTASSLIIIEKTESLRRLFDAAIARALGWPGLFYAAMFIWSFSICELFESARMLVHLVGEGAKALLHA